MPAGPITRQRRTIEPTKSLQSFEFSTNELPREERFKAWRESYASIFDLDHPEEVNGGFSARHRVWDLGSLIFSRVSTNGLDFATRAGRGRRDPLDHWLLTLLLDGHSTTVAGSRQLVGNVGSVQLHPLGQAFEGNISRSQMLMLFVPRDLCRDMAHVLDAAAFSRLEGGMGRIFADYMISLAGRLPLLDASDLPELIAATRAMVLACIAPSPERLEEAGNSFSHLLLERARRYIQANLHDPQLDAQKILRDLGISRTRLYRLFETSGGVMRYVQRRRLAAAHEALTNLDDGRRILEIAESYCFGDAAEFSRAFRREFDYTPSEARAGARHDTVGRSPAHTDPTGEPRQRLNLLLRHLQG
jgi:AraC-like DNA-binding protein